VAWAVVDVWHWGCGGHVALGLWWTCGTGAVVDMWHWGCFFSVYFTVISAMLQINHTSG